MLLGLEVGDRWFMSGACFSWMVVMWIRFGYELNIGIGLHRIGEVYSMCLVWAYDVMVLFWWAVSLGLAFLLVWVTNCCLYGFHVPSNLHYFWSAYS